MEKVAAIDIGTNSMRLLLCELKGNKLYSRSKELITTRIGHEVAKSGILSKKAIDRNIEALKSFGNKAKAFGAEKIIAIATSAVRDAENKEEFLNLAKEETGIEVKVIEGKEEAELGMIGVMSEFGSIENNILVIDIGGGSTELILGDDSSIKYLVSKNAGAVRMTENFVTENPIPKENIEVLAKNLDEIFFDTIKALKDYKIDEVVAIGGTATTLASMYHELKLYDSAIVHNSVLDLDYLKNSFNKISNMTIAQRYDIIGLQRERADVIPAGLYILIFLLECLNKTKVTISENDNLEGAVLKYIANKHA